MDGEQRIKIVTAHLGWPNGICLDVEQKRVYWTDAQLKHIESCDYDGNNRKIIISELQHPYGIAVTDMDVYWTDWKSKALHMVNKNNASNTKVIKSDIEGLMGVRVISVSGR